MMQRVSTSAFLFALVLLLGTGAAFARGPDWCPRRSKQQPTPDRIDRTRSAWCREHPDQCAERSPEDQKCRTQQERYMDQKGNRDGYVSQWERDRFGGPYRPWN